jgi:two-component system sensor histidine kinase PilS (NtrC family)
MPEIANSANPALVAAPQPNGVPFRIYTWYRLALTAALIAMLVSTLDAPLVGRDNPQLFIALCCAYFLFAAIVLVVLPHSARLSSQHLFVHIFIDIGFLIALSHLSGGTASGLGMLLLVSVAAGSLLLGGQLALLAAALASLGVLSDTVYLINENDSHQSLLATSTLGTLFFAAALGFQNLSQRLRSSQQLAQERSADVSKLQNLNQLIVQRMRTGILVVDVDGHVKMTNQAAAEYLRAAQPLEPDDNSLSTALHAQLDNWKRNPDVAAKPFRNADTGPEIIARFTALDQDAASFGHSGDTLVFLEDSGQLAQRAQQLKLAALGRLTASIAHEIRNPLGAISHAGQLLRESPQIDGGDQRLAEIVVNHAHRINTIIENVLQLSRRSPPNPRRIDLGGWLHNYVEEYQEGLPERAEISIQERWPALVNVDPEQLGQVLTNLIDNALRYSKKATGKPSAILIVSKCGKQLPQLDVIDHGAGIAERDQEKVFEPFFTTETGGNGLGLYMARELCETNQARLHYLRSESGKSCFRISFSHPDRKPLINE